MTRATPYWISLALFLGTGVILYLMGRDLICPCGYVELWAGDAPPEQSSQHIADWYTPSHLLHGLLFYAALWLVAPRMPISWRFAIAMLVECGWELVENSAWVIERYRSVTVSFDYNGDSIVNALADIVAMVVGFALARVIPVWASVALVIGFELLTAYLIRDGLVLNVVMLLWPLDAILQWQQAG
ncbi:DUF2585 family protein [Psychromarinibacter sp. C21-152]|uniref:DUF2585 family protein n=1 Tax=Psychromarinibacter sediminicola TaxID=3033385 RepID=A0AAE3T8J1_9RHOB|nr:DUF2585 family protein [Psychromarinibacter sediminicola]MDF0601312.1 DUF2585 family protein [Psychromarinibacter sediminicola]